MWPTIIRPVARCSKACSRASPPAAAAIFPFACGAGPMAGRPLSGRSASLLFEHDLSENRCPLSQIMLARLLHLIAQAPIALGAGGIGACHARKLFVASCR